MNKNVFFALGLLSMILSRSQHFVSTIDYGKSELLFLLTAFLLILAGSSLLINEYNKNGFGKVTNFILISDVLIVVTLLYFCSKHYTASTEIFYVWKFYLCVALWVLLLINIIGIGCLLNISSKLRKLGIK